VFDRIRDERGAIAVLTAILAFVLFGVSALAVDLGKMYARSGDAKTAADLAALAGAGALVDQDDRRAEPSAGFEGSDADRAMEAAHATLEANAVYSDGDGFDIPGENAPVWTNGNESDGEIDVDVDAMRVTVAVPPRTVRFGLAAIFGLGQSTVAARAVAEVRAPGQLLPFYLPDEDGCRTESQFMTMPPTDPGRPYHFVPAVNGPDAQVPLLTPGTLAMDGLGRVTIVGDRFEPSGMRVRFTLGNRNETARSADIDLVEIDPLGDDRLRVRVPIRVRNMPGEWAIRVENSFGWGGPLDPPHLLLSIGLSVIDACGENPAGDLALFTPNSGGTDLTSNIINGLSDELSLGDAVTINPQVLTVDQTTAGLVSPTGRLAGPPTPGCDQQPPRSVSGTSINNDVLSCFLDNRGHGGHSVEGTLPDDCNGFPADLNAHPGRSLLPSIFSSPRFFFVPVLAAPIGPTAFDGNIPVTEFRAVFLTDETEGGGDTPADLYSDSTQENGLSISRSSIDQIQVFAFCPDELPNATDEGGNGFPWQPGLPTAIRLVQ